MTESVPTSDWIKGIALSVAASLIGSASKLAIRKSWLLERPEHRNDDEDELDINDLTLTENLTATEDNLPIVSQSSSNCSEHSNESSTHQALRYRSSLQIPSEEDDLHAPLSPRSHQRRTMWKAYILRGAGMVGMTFLNPLCGVVAMNYANPSILAPFSGLTLVWIILLSGPLIREPPTYRQISAALLIVFGELTVGLYGDHTNDERVTTAQIQASYFQPPFVAFFLAVIMWMSLLGYWIRYSKDETLRRLAWGVSGGSITGLQNFLKDCLTILKDTQLRIPMRLPWFFYLFLLLAVVSAFGGLLLLTACMKRYDATYSASAFVGSFVVSTSVMSSIHYRTFQHLDGVANYVLYPIGIGILMLGVLVLVLDAPRAYGQVPVDASSDDGSVSMGSHSSPRRVRMCLCDSIS